MEPATTFVKQSIKLGFLANAFIVVDTHSDGLTGHLQAAGGSTSPRHCAITQLLDEFIGRDFLLDVKQASQFARADSSARGQVWYRKDPYWRGGWRCVVMSTCGPAIRVEAHLEKAQLLVNL